MSLSALAKPSASAPSFPPCPFLPSHLFRRLLRPFHLGQNPPQPSPLSRVLSRFPPPHRPPGRIQGPIANLWLYPAVPWVLLPLQPPPCQGNGQDTHRQGRWDGASRPALLGDGGGFNQLPLLPGEHRSRGAEPLPSAPLSARPPFLTAPVTFAGRSVRRARVAPPRFLIGSVARPETGKAEPASRSEAEARGTLAALRGHRGQRDPRTGGDV